MPLTKKGRKIMSAMRSEYGDNAERVFYASRNKGTIKGVEKDERARKRKGQVLAIKHLIKKI